jgi:tRNA-dihydrouridine synthase C
MPCCRTRCYTRLSPELANGARTAAGTPVRIQLLGNDAEMLAANAAHLARLHPFGIDLNFGCPTPLVNRNRGGAALLNEPELLHRIAAAVRAAVPREMPVTAKMRLGIDDTSKAIDCALALEAGGVNELVVHARTRADGYKPLARWEWVAHIRAAVKLPLIANGEVWTVADWHAIRAATGCDDVMLGRGAVADPLLARRIRGNAEAEPIDADWREVEAMLADFWARVQRKVLPAQSPGRLKQWLGLMRRSYPQAETLFPRRARSPARTGGQRHPGTRRRSRRATRGGLSVAAMGVVGQELPVSLYLPRTFERLHYSETCRIPKTC